MIKQAVIDLGLDAPNAFFNIDNGTLAMMTGGCGPGKFGDFLVPDTVYGLSIKSACVVHDFEYAIGKTIEDKKKADLRFLANMLKIVNDRSGFTPLRVVRRYRVMSYYSAVADGGSSAFEKATLN